MPYLSEYGDFLRLKVSVHQCQKRPEKLYILESTDLKREASGEFNNYLRKANYHSRWIQKLLQYSFLPALLHKEPDQTCS
jgi:hypothetical protein